MRILNIIFFVVFLFASTNKASELELNQQLEEQLRELEGEYRKSEEDINILKQKVENLKYTVAYVNTGMKPEPPQKRLTPIYSEAFNGTTPLWNFYRNTTQKCQYIKFSDIDALEFCNEEENESAWIIARTLSLENLKGKTLVFAIKVKGENISPRPRHYMGIKFEPHYAQKIDLTHSAHIGVGTFDWTTVNFSFNVPEKVTTEKFPILLGLSHVTGKVWFRDLQVSILE